MPRLYTVSEVARKIGARPRDITNLLYRRKLRDDLFPIIGGRRFIPEEQLEAVALELKRARQPVSEEWQRAADRMAAESRDKAQAEPTDSAKPVESDSPQTWGEASERMAAEHDASVAQLEPMTWQDFAQALRRTPGAVDPRAERRVMDMVDDLVCVISPSYATESTIREVRSVLLERGYAFDTAVGLMNAFRDALRRGVEHRLFKPDRCLRIDPVTATWNTVDGTN